MREKGEGRSKGKKEGAVMLIRLGRREGVDGWAGEDGRELMVERGRRSGGS